MVVELVVLGVGLALYLRATATASSVGRFAPWVLAAVLAASALLTVFGESSDVDSAATSGLVAYLLLPAVAWLVERRRQPRPLRATSLPRPAVQFRPRGVSGR